MSFEALSPSRLPSWYTYSIKFLAIHLIVKIMLSFTYSSSFFNVPVPYCLVSVPKKELHLPGLQESYVRNCVSIALQQRRAQRCQPANSVGVREGACYRRQVLSPSSFGSQLPPLSLYLFVRLCLT